MGACCEKTPSTTRQHTRFPRNHVPRAHAPTRTHSLFHRPEKPPHTNHHHHHHSDDTLTAFALARYNDSTPARSRSPMSRNSRRITRTCADVCLANGRDVMRTGMTKRRTRVRTGRMVQLELNAHAPAAPAWVSYECRRVSRRRPLRKSRTVGTRRRSPKRSPGGAL